MLVVLVVSEIRKSIAVLLCSEPSNVAIGSFFNHFSVTWFFFFNLRPPALETDPLQSTRGN